MSGDLLRARRQRDFSRQWAGADQHRSGLKARFVVNGKEPKVVIVVTVEQAFQHCPKALLRSNLWQSGDEAGRPQCVPTLGGFSAAREPERDKEAVDAAYYGSVMQRALLRQRLALTPSPPSPGPSDALHFAWRADAGAGAGSHRRVLARARRELAAAPCGAGDLGALVHRTAFGRATKRPETIHDFYGFPKNFIGSSIRRRVRLNLRRRCSSSCRRGIPAASDNEYGLDHGAWVPLNPFIRKPM